MGSLCPGQWLVHPCLPSSVLETQPHPEQQAEDHGAKAEDAQGWNLSPFLEAKEFGKEPGDVCGPVWEPGQQVGSSACREAMLFKGERRLSCLNLL